MHSEVTPRRYVLTWMFVIWLGIQGMVLGLTPAWGYFVPHSHVTHGSVTEADWEAHLEAHLHAGAVAVAWAASKGCSPAPNVAGPIVTSYPDAAGMTALYSGWDSALPDPGTLVSPPPSVAVALNTHSPVLWDIVYAPPDPPPDL